MAKRKAGKDKPDKPPGKPPGKPRKLAARAGLFELIGLAAGFRFQGSIGHVFLQASAGSYQLRFADSVSEEVGGRSIVAAAGLYQMRFASSVSSIEFTKRG